MNSHLEKRHTSVDAISILLIDDHTLFRSGIHSLLRRYPEFSIVGEAADGAEGIKRARQLQPDVVLLDLNMPGISGLQTLQMIMQECPRTAVIMLTVSEDAEDLGAALQSGARGYLIKNIDADYLVHAIQRAASGESVVAESMTGKLISQLQQAGQRVEEHSELDKLTPRERDILACLARGESNKIIARTLNVADSTVKIHVQNILKKLKLSSRVQAAIFAVGHGIGDGKK